MNSYTQEYTNLMNNINENRKKINLLNVELEQTTEMRNKAILKLLNEEFQLRELGYQKNKVIEKKDKLISIPMTILTLLIEFFLLSSVYNIIMLPEGTLFKVLVGCVTLPIGACTCIAAILGSNALTRKIQSKLHEHMSKKSYEYKEIEEKIKNENIRLEPMRVESDRLGNKISEIKSELSKTNETVDSDLKKLKNLRNEIINMVISEEKVKQEVIKPNIRVRSKLN